eukprot:gene5659-3682_t
MRRRANRSRVTDWAKAPATTSVLYDAALPAHTALPPLSGAVGQYGFGAASAGGGPVTWSAAQATSADRLLTALQWEGVLYVDSEKIQSYEDYERYRHLAADESAEDGHVGGLHQYTSEECKWLAGIPIEDEETISVELMKSVPTEFAAVVERAREAGLVVLDTFTISKRNRIRSYAESVGDYPLGSQFAAGAVDSVPLMSRYTSH